MKKKIIVFVLSILLSVIGISATLGLRSELWTSKPSTVDSSMYSGISAFTEVIVRLGMGFISIAFTGTAIILETYCIKNCTGIMRNFSIALCVLCSLALASALISLL